MIYDDLEFDGTNDIRIDPWKIRECKMHSISNAETIRQISLFCKRNPGNNDLWDRIDPMLQYAGLYPEVMKRFDILPYDKETADAIMESGRKMIEDMSLELIANRMSGKFESSCECMITNQELKSKLLADNLKNKNKSKK